MIGTIVNTGTIILGTLVGCIAKHSIKKEYQGALFDAMGFAAVALGINSIVNNLPNSSYPVLFIVSLATGSLFGTILDIDGRFQRFVDRYSKSNLGQGLAAGILLYCIGALSIVGPVMSAVLGDNTFLFTNATLDLVTSMVFGATYGLGMVFAAPVLFLWQGSIYGIACFLSASFFSEDLIREISIVGGILIASSGLSILKIKDVKTLNMLPALAVPMVFFLVEMIIR